jgi:hypothetical protein
MSLNALASMNRKRIEQYQFAFESNRQKRLLRNQAEYAWEKSGRPYYNLHPQLVPAISKTNLETIPARFIEVPGNFPAVNLRFSTTEHRFSPIMGMLFAKQSDGFRLFVDIGRREAFNGYPVTLCQTLHLPFAEGDESIPIVLERLLDRCVAKAAETSTKDNANEVIMLMSSFDWYLDILRIAVTVGFLANQNDEMIVRDVLSKERAAHAEAIKRGNDSRRSKIENRAARRGKLGWNVGTNEMFVDWYPPKQQELPEGVRGPHKFAHIRTGHFHAVRCGKSRSQVKVKWFRPTVVRPDLPFAKK